MMTEQCADVAGLVDPTKIPRIDTSKIDSAESTLRSLGKGVEDETVDVRTTWYGLRTCLVVPAGADGLYDLMDPAVEQARDFNTRMKEAANALKAFSSDIAPFRQRFEDLRSEATTFRNDVIDGVEVPDRDRANYGGIVGPIRQTSTPTKIVPWYDDSDTLTKNRHLIGRINEAVAELTGHEATCADRINGQAERTCFAPATSYSADQLHASTDLPWGHARKYEPKNCGESVAMGVSDVVVGTVEGLGGLAFGYDPDTGEWFQGDQYAQSWSGLGNLALSVLVVSLTPLTMAADIARFTDPGNGFTQFVDDRRKVVVNTVTSMVNIDLYADDPLAAWKDDPVRAATSGVLNVGSIFVPGANVAKPLQMTGMAGRAANVAVNTLDNLLPGAAALANLAIDGSRFGVGAIDDFSRAASFADDAARMAPLADDVLRLADDAASFSDDFARFGGFTDDVARFGDDAARFGGLSDDILRFGDEAIAASDDAVGALDDATRGADRGASHAVHESPIEFTNRDGSTMTSHPDGATQVEAGRSNVVVNADGSLDITTRGTKDTVETIHVDVDGTQGPAVREGDGRLTSPQVETLPEGGTRVELGDGTVITQDADGTVRQQHPNGSTTVRNADGTIDANVFDNTSTRTGVDGTSVQNRADGSVVTRTPDGGSHTVRPDGSTFAHDGNGTYTSTRADGASTSVTDGTTTVRHADGSTTTVGRDGSVSSSSPEVSTVTRENPNGGRVSTTTHPDGTTTTTRVDGNGHTTTTTTFADGSRTTVMPDGSVRDTVVHPDGSTSTTYADGSVMDAHPNGQPVIYGDPRLADGSAMGSFDNAGEQVPVSEHGTRNGALVEGQPLSPELRELLDRPNSPVEIRDGAVSVRQSVTVDFDLPDMAESGRQLGLQNTNLNQLTLEQIMENRAAYDEAKAANANTSRPMTTYRNEVIAARTEQLMDAHPDMSEADAKALATNEIKNLPALHGPDRVAGGNHTNFTGFEDSVAGTSVNSTIGSQWGHGRANAMVTDLQLVFRERGIPSHLWGDIRVNVDLTSNGGSWRP